MPDIERFDHYVARILGALYEEFPVKTDLDVRRLTGHARMNEDGAICAPDGRESRNARIAYATIEWLVDAGYVRAQEPRFPIGFRQCVLTAEGLRALGAVPDSLPGGETVGDRIAGFVREGAADLARNLVRAALGLE